MDSRKYIGMDVHQASISVAVTDADPSLHSRHEPRYTCVLQRCVQLVTRSTASPSCRSQNTVMPDHLRACARIAIQRRFRG